MQRKVSLTAVQNQQLQQQYRYCATQATQPAQDRDDQSRAGGSIPGPQRIQEAYRLLALQQELAQLKRTPSMQLLARQRIPRLEEAIKHLIASLAASA